ncbi:MAG TPA: polyphosphate kinase 2 family protein [Actinomycetota bacterium]|nr:polyphosphate kinase 2 family protein [Actinomycetota bacterium]
MCPSSIVELLRVDPADSGPTGIEPRSTPGVESREAAHSAMTALADRLDELQERLWVEAERSLLVVLQGMDTSGKGGTIRHVFSAMHPAGVEVATFKRPTEEELAHHFLWRIERRLPAPGEVVVFDRSHYEDVLIARVRSLVPEQVWRARYAEIVEFERRVAAAGTTIVKCMLHISYDEQRERLLARLEDPSKRWKFNEGDLEERARWNEYMAAYADAIRECSTDDAPWHVIPADRKWYRNWAISSLLVETLERMDPRFPVPDLDLQALRSRLAPPG